MLLTVHPTIQIYCLPKKHFNSVYAHFHISWYSQSSSLVTHLQRSPGALQTSVSQVAWPIRNLGDTVKFSGGQVRQVYLFLSLLLLLHKAVIVNYSRGIKLPWHFNGHCIGQQIMGFCGFTESQNVWGWNGHLKAILYDRPVEAGPPRARTMSRHLLSSYKEGDSTTALATCASAHSKKNVSWYSKGASCVSACACCLCFILSP